MTDHRIPLAGVIGNPVAHSRSPDVHGHWLKRYDLPGHYIPLHVEDIDLEQVLRSLPQMGFAGVNVTIPHKVRAMELADFISDRVTLIGAANTLTFRDGKIYADNTDAYGFLASLRQGAPDWNAAAGPALVLGAGGASRAIVSALLEAGAPEVVVANRTRSKAEGLRADFGARLRVVEWVTSGDQIADMATVVNTTSLGMQGQPALKLDLSGFKRGQVVTDIVYTPLMTPFLSEAKSRGATVVDGLGMLLHQAVPGFERWFGQRPEVDDDLRRAILG
ncbi:shikimate 5-dehydrogenase [Ketogulonicigenium robustum]|uniref:Shikimate dehydrogenase (NADP(+)) n=1 Tax=Ketogulonicigenium robustum TaxID=92947 RepID=A0A1W6P2G0_9RHOB|nr:shikimate dehydrogenase [Ketogulonicigenium robustum]ARO15698.1 shikimate 5-dehydrogenase [Ketogulonicigenium robustum]